METENKVLFICTGNTCRSPMAEGIFKKACVDREGLSSLGSAGVAAYDGDIISKETAAELKRRGAELSNFRSRSVSEDMLREATHVFAMTMSHLGMLTSHFPEYAEKCYLVCDFIEVNGKASIDLPDPIGMGAPAYRQVAEVLEAAIPALIDFIDAGDELAEA